MKSSSSASFLLLCTVVFHFFSSTAAVENDSKPPIISKGDSKLSQSDGRKFCVSKPEASDAQLKKNLDWACKQGIDCSPVEPGAVCDDPASLRSRADFAMNTYYRTRGETKNACDFEGTGRLIDTNPSYGECTYL
ncbi:hypothetical protein ERO13_A10G219100v2 [Gossypium hirsutum]|uniref:Major pollen allergen Ole e 10 n=1 Tax=Gossypium hirsutum TaxID=3635 RepID=A0A1U8M9S2_GOSHI|nr:major pollen allergen Ole e 10-like [Gossypium hirsutum]KAG4181309.1 hypothetical protein ERO13_A10G219100v2 [Gossypium hirsutum]